MAFFRSHLHASCSAAGRRPNNEDRGATVRVGNYTIAVVADGMGGARAGEIASHSAVDAFLKEVRSCRPGNERATLRRAFRLADDAIRGAATPGREGMGSTMVAAIVRERAVWVGNIGDSRALLVTGDEVIPLSTEHSVVGEAFRAGQMDEVEALNSPYRHAISRALGDGDGRPDITFRTLKGERGEGDAMLVLGSDGVFNHVGDAELLDLTDSARTAPRLAHDLVVRALKNGSDDNATAAAVVVREARGRRGRSSFLLALFAILAAFAAGVYSSRSVPRMRQLLGSSQQRLKLQPVAHVTTGMGGVLCAPSGQCFGTWRVLRADADSAVLQIEAAPSTKHDSPPPATSPQKP